MKKKVLFQLILASALLAVSACHADINLEEPEQPVIEEEVPQQGTTIWAGFDNPTTKTGLSINDAGTRGDVVWKSGDSFVLYPLFPSGSGMYTSEGILSYTFTTTADNVTSAEFSCPSTSIYGAEYYGAIYPSGQPANLDGSHKAFIVSVPATQPAVAGSFDPSSCPMFAFTAQNESYEHLFFHNVCSLLKLRVTGDGVSSLVGIKLACGGSTIACKDIVIYDYDSEWKHGFITSSEQSSYVTLTGSFASDTDYYIAIIPGTFSGVSISFIYDDGSVQSKSVNQSVTFARSQIRNLGTFNLTAGGDPNVVKYKSSEKTKPVNLCVLSEGFTSDQRESFENLAKSGIDFLFTVDPYKSLESYFNVYLMWAPSQDQGASITDGAGNVTTARNTAFGAKWGASSYDDMIADSDAVFDYVSARCPEIVREEATIAEVPILLIINDSRYGGRAISFENGQTYCLVPYTDNGGPLQWAFPQYVASSDEPVSPLVYRAVTSEERAEMGVSTGDWHNTMLHEFGGHSIGRLADEYWPNEVPSSVPGQGPVERHSWAVPFGLNVSGYYATVPWQSLLDMRTSLITNQSELYSRIGKYQGGEVKIFNRWRSEKISCMIDNRAYFSAWQRVLIAKRIVELAGETFTLSAYMTTDNPIDPIRDGSPAPDPTATKRGSIPVMPPLAPPMLIDMH